MLLGIVLSLVSSLQICQQSVLSEPSEELPDTQFAIASAAFPLGKFVSTIILAVFPASASKALVIDAVLLIVGAVFAAVQIPLFLYIGRFLMGCGAGIGFVSATVLLFEMIPYSRRPTHFFVLGLAFALATFMVNGLRMINFNQSETIAFSSLFTAGCGALYLLLGPHRIKYEYAPICSDDNMRSKFVQSNFPTTLIYALMVLNVSIGVPFILGFSHLIFEEFGATYDEASLLSIAFPFAQIVLILVLYNTVLNRRWLVVGGYGVAVFIQALLLLTSIYPFLPPKHHMIAKSFFLWLLIVVSSVPCNTSLCLIAEQFSNLSEQTKYTSRGRALMWILAAISTGTFPLCLSSYGFAASFLPYLIISLFTLLVVAHTYPKFELDSAA